MLRLPVRHAVEVVLRDRVGERVRVTLTLSEGVGEVEGVGGSVGDGAGPLGEALWLSEPEEECVWLPLPVRLGEGEEVVEEETLAEPEALKDTSAENCVGWASRRSTHRMRRGLCMVEDIPQENVEGVAPR